MKYFIVDAFADAVFKGNPAGVCLLEDELDDIVMQNIAAENNLSETAFTVKREGYYDLRCLRLKWKLIYAVTQHWEAHM